VALPLRDDATPTRVPWVTYSLILVNVVVFLFLQPSALQGGATENEGLGGTDATEVSEFFYKWGAVPCEIQHLAPLEEGIRCEGDREAGAPSVDGKIVLLSVLTCMFIHGSLLHLAGNMLFLWVFGATVEDRVGPVPYVALYLATGIVATLGHAAANWDDAVPALGASGAIAGIMGAHLVFRPRGRVLSLVFWTVVYVPAWVLLGLFFVTQFFIPDSEGVAWVAHAAGMVAGFLAALVLARFFRDPSAARPSRASAASPSTWVLPEAPPIAAPSSGTGSGST